MTYDVIISERIDSAPALSISFKNEKAAEKVAKVMKENQKELFQADGLKVFVVATNRDRVPEAQPSEAPSLFDA